ncbi:MAG: hypothetical protein A3F72_18985 [Bacteroidetes bacterium RIFCSPLOWO2_12_FULL_35_15]|nr:MAG: hypothetical protein A3F72_18985 [Bacteroidetes bacterium RIFCSPLOWO2_12_FULL_35_15]
MRQKRKIYLQIFLLFTMTLGSCVSKREFLKSESKNKEQENILSSLSKSNDSLYLALEAKDAIIDSLNYKISGITLKKTKNPAEGKKGSLSKRQESDKKAVFIYNFTKYIEWPIEYNGIDFIIGVLGDEQALRQLQEFMSLKKVAGKKITVEKFSKNGKYNLVYITSLSNSSFEDIKNRFKKHKTLLVTDKETPGSHISFSIEQDKIKYTLNKTAIEKVGLKVGQELIHYSE